MKHLITILFFILAISVQAQQGMLLVSSPAASPPATTGILDSYTGAAAAYATALLYSGYSGSCLRVRRDSDDAEQDIGFSGQDIDEAAINSFCSGANCFVKTWYDQSGSGNDATQATTTRQPKIYDSSTGIIYENSVAALQTLGINRSSFSLSSDISSSNSNYSIFYVTNHSTNATQRIFDNRVGIFSGNAGRFIIHAYGGGGAYLLNGVNYGTQFGNGHALKTYLFVDPTSNIYLNGSFNQSSLYTQMKIVANGTISSPDSGYEVDGTMQVAVFYTSDQSANRTGIETIINNYFSIY